MDDSLYDDIYNELNRFPEEPDSDSVEYSLAFNYDDDLTALGMLRQAEHHILKMIDDD